MKKPIAALCAATVLIGGTGTAAAHTTHVPTTVLVDETDYVTVDRFMMRGHLETTRKCRAKRRIKVFIRYLSDPSQCSLVDQGTSTTTGY